MQRREFIRTTATILFAGVAVQILGCSDSANYGNGLGSGAGGGLGPGDVSGTIAAPDTQNHPIPGNHFTYITKAEIARGKFLILSIKGNAGHDHTVALSEAEQRDIANGIQVVKVSTEGKLTPDSSDHYHTVMFN